MTVHFYRSYHRGNDTLRVLCQESAVPALGESTGQWSWNKRPRAGTTTPSRVTCEACLTQVLAKKEAEVDQIRARLVRIREPCS